MFLLQAVGGLSGYAIRIAGVLIVAGLIFTLLPDSDPTSVPDMASFVQRIIDAFVTLNGLLPSVAMLLCMRVMAASIVFFDFVLPPVIVLGGKILGRTAV